MLNRNTLISAVAIIVVSSLLNAEMETVLKVYKVKEGDTFFKISQEFYNTGEKWKNIWEYNKYIKNSHWIFPGDTLIVPTYRKKIEGKEKDEETVVTNKSAVVLEKVSEENHDVFIAPYYAGEEDPIDFKYAGKIIAFTGENAMNSQRAKLIIDIGKGDDVKKNMQFDVYRMDKKVHHPETKEIVGILIKKIGKITVSDDIEETSSIAQIDHSQTPLQIGDYVRAIPEKK